MIDRCQSPLDLFLTILTAGRDYRLMAVRPIRVADRAGRVLRCYCGHDSAKSIRLDDGKEKKDYEVYKTTDSGAEQRLGDIRGRVPGERYWDRIPHD
jgi:hypothetical protein